MSRVLYRKYRSQNFDELIGQSHITDILKNAVKSDSIAHAYLFVGSRGTGKTSTARILAKAINCPNQKDGNPCNDCTVCTSITDGNFMDLIEIDAASNRGIDQIRELKERIEYAPTEGKFKIYIIDEVHMLTNEAFNALLKTLEEPPSHVVFMLATTDVHKLPATILSRCQRYDFKLGTEAEIRGVIAETSEHEGVKLAAPALDILVENAHGSYRDALSLLDVVVSGQIGSDKPEEVSEGEVRRILGIPDTTMVYYLLEKLVQGDVKSGLKLISELESKGVNLQQFTKYVLTMLREILVAKATDTLDPQKYGFGKTMSERMILKYINAFLMAERNLRNAHTPALILEMLVVELASTNLDVHEKSENVVVKDGGSNKSSSKGEEKKGTNKKKESKSVKKAVSKPVVKSKEKAEVVEEKVSAKNEKADKQDTVVEEAGEKVATPRKAGKAPSNLDVKEIESKWDEVVKASQKHNGHLFAFLKNAQVDRVEDGALILHVGFEFHKDRIEDPKGKEAVHSSLEEVFGYSFPVRCEVNGSVKRKKKVTADVVLKSIQQAAEVTQATKDKDEAKGNGGNGKSAAEAKPRKMSKKVEAIFEGM